MCLLRKLLRLRAVGSPCRNGSDCAAVDQFPWGSGQAPGQVRGMGVRSRAQAVPPGPPSVCWGQPGAGDRDQVSECRGLGPPGHWAAMGLRPLPPLPRSFQPAQHQSPEGCPWEASPTGERRWLPPVSRPVRARPQGGSLLIWLRWVNCKATPSLQGSEPPQAGSPQAGSATRRLALLGPCDLGSSVSAAKGVTGRGAKP